MKKNWRPKPCTACGEEFAPNSGRQIHCFKCGLRRCSKCGQVKDTSEYSYSKKSPDHCHHSCKDCDIESMRQRLQDPKERERVREYMSEYYRRRCQDPEFKEREREYNRQRYQDPEYRERKREYNRRPEVRERVREYYRQRCQDPEFKERERERGRVRARQVNGCVPLENRTCARCGDTFDATNGPQVYCEPCRPKAERERWHKHRDERSDIPPGLREWSLKYWNCKCPNCGSDLDNYHLDHHFPLTPQEGKLGRPLVPGNIVPLCQSCNKSKRNTDPNDFYPDSILADIQQFLVRQMIEFDYVPDFTDQPRDTSHELFSKR